MHSNISHIFSNNPLNRGEIERRSEEWINKVSGSKSTQFIPVSDSQILLQKPPIPGEGIRTLGWITKEDIDRLKIINEPLLLGLLQDVTCFAIDVSNQVDAMTELESDDKFEFVDTRTAAEITDNESAGIIAQARSQVKWHMMNRFCSSCGYKTLIGRGGQAIHCSNCGIIHYPRTDPVIITVVYHKDMCLLGQTRGRSQSANRYSALAGYIDQGESIEEAVIREVMEESGIQIGNVKYQSSQPWPFPYSLMIGCHAEAITTSINFDTEEMRDVRWFDRDDVLLALSGKNESLVLPGPIAIAHHIIKSWAEQEQ